METTISNSLQTFTNETIGANVRVVIQNGEPLFVAKDICECLEISKYRDALTRLDDDERVSVEVDTLGGKQQMAAVNEYGLYNLILGSRKPSAKQFKRWITHDVIPSIRKHGIYATDEAVDKIINDPDFGIKLLQELKAEREKSKNLEKTVIKQAEQIADMQPKSAYCETILQCPDVIATTGIAKDYGMSAKAFNKLLNRLGIQFKQGGIWYLYQHLANNGYMQTKTWEKFDNAGIRHAVTHNYWTQKGRLFLYKLLKSHDVLPVMEQLDFYGSHAY